MIPLGLSADDQAAYERTLASSHRIRKTVRVHDRDERVIHEFQGAILSGSVHVDMSGTTSQLGFAAGDGNSSGRPVRTLELTVLLPRKDQAWNPSTPGEAAFADNFISVEYGVWVEDLAAGPGWVDVPIFWGPITGIDQDGDQITIRGSGKEVLGMDPVLLWKTINVYPGQSRVGAIRWILANIGEKRFDLPAFTSKMRNRWSLDRRAEPWVMASSIARYGNWQLFYDGRGRARLREYPRNVMWTWRSGEGGTLLTKPKISYDLSAMRNVVEVVGSPPSGSTRQIRTESRPPSWHPLSPWSLRRNGERRNVVHVEDNADVNNRAEARALGDRLLDQHITAGVQIEFDSLVIPHLEEGDRVAVKVGPTYASGPQRVLEGQTFEFSLLQFTIPLSSDEPMSIGLNRRVSWRRRGETPFYRWTR
ncbi:MULTISPECIES: hypothetical protein [Prauserella salsuginis group]|uniref:Minor tail protein n=1 Tax=Prauserella salsuginis TaxID=387889 RepID=A0ABW6G5Q1_9PSEU|nr:MULTISPECIES: hypothetical protein [Prauserella salsuginis group]MCR3719129.1 hypothetical protein [Prauserella flava]MCR3735858.1 hypothetical protein [Prauserella salsuginis]